MTRFVAFQLLDLRVGRVINVQLNEAARKPAYKIWIDFGPQIGVKTSSDQCTQLYEPDDLIGCQVVCAVNLGERRIAGFNSQVLVLGVPDTSAATVRLTTEREVRLGTRVF